MYPPTKELVEGSSLKALTDLTEAQQDALRTEAITAVEAFCHQGFEEEGTKEAPVERVVDGSAARTLYLPKRLVELVELSVAGGALTTVDVALDEHHARLHIPSEGDGSTWASRAVSELSGAQSTTFPSGPGSVMVSGVWGWADAEFPAAVETALRYDMEDRAIANAHALADSVRSARALGLTSVAQGGLSVELGSREATVSARVARVLDHADLVWHQTAGGLA